MEFRAQADSRPSPVFALFMAQTLIRVLPAPEKLLGAFFLDGYIKKNRFFITFKQWSLVVV